MNEVPLTLYVHLPWCLTKCPYCDFNSHQGIPQEDDYLASLLQELQSRVTLADSRKIQSIYCGGGTPNLFSVKFYGTLLDRIDRLYKLTPECEITLEVNPGEGRCHDFIGYHKAGINRLSIGAQSFDNKLLASIGRDYTCEHLEDCLDRVQDCPIDNINIDLIFALPYQTCEQAIYDFNRATAYLPKHISIYEMTIEPNTAFYSQRPSGLPDADYSADIYQQLLIKAQQQGYCHYEVSAFAKLGKESIHNCNYWQFGDYIGVGAGAHGKISVGNPLRITRYHNHKLPQRYMKAINYTVSQQHLDQHDIFCQWCLNSFRLVRGVNLINACRNTGLSKYELIRKLEPYREHLIINANNIKLTEHSFLHQNRLLERIFS